MRDLTCLVAGVLSVCGVSIASGASVTFRVAVPAGTPAGDTVYIAGSFQGWNPGSPAHALEPEPDGRWAITLDLPDGAPIQFKFTRGTWARVEKGPNGEEIPNRVHTPSGVQTLELQVARWADLAPSTITGHVEWFEFGPFLSGRRCWVYLPPGYDAGAERYPVLYMHDGQNLFDDATSFAGEWRVDEACEALIAAGEIGPVIVVGIENGGASRCLEYTPWADAGVGCGGGGSAYLAAIRDTLMPEVDRRYRTRPGEAFMAGSSLGGLISAYAGYAFSAWSRIAAVSPSYWFDGAEMLAFASAAGRPALLERFYQDMGSAESGVGNLNAMRSIALAQGFVEGGDFTSLIAPGHQHNEFYWAQRVPGMLRFLVGPPAGCNAADLDANGLLDLADINAFVAALLAQDPDADLAPPAGVFDLSDINAFVAAFVSGCG